MECQLGLISRDARQGCVLRRDLLPRPKDTPICVMPPYVPSLPQVPMEPLLICLPFWIYLRVICVNLPPVAMNCVTTVTGLLVSTVLPVPGPQKDFCPCAYGLYGQPDLSQLFPLQGCGVMSVACELHSRMSISLQQ